MERASLAPALNNFSDFRLFFHIALRKIRGVNPMCISMFLIGFFIIIIKNSVSLSPTALSGKHW